MTGNSPKGHCLKHDGHCKSIEYLEQETERIRLSLKDKTNEIKDTRKSLGHDIDRFEDDVKKTYVTKTEFDQVKRLVNYMTMLLVAEVIRRVLT